MTVENCQEHTGRQLQYNLQNAQGFSKQLTLSRQHGVMDDSVISVYTAKLAVRNRHNY